MPARLQEQIYAHLLMRYRTDLEGLQQQEIIDSLPKAIQSSISHYLFFSIIDKVYLFHGVSNDLLFQLVIFCVSHILLHYVTSIGETQIFRMTKI